MHLPADLHNVVNHPLIERVSDDPTHLAQCVAVGRDDVPPHQTDNPVDNIDRHHGVEGRLDDVEHENQTASQAFQLTKGRHVLCAAVQHPLVLLGRLVPLLEVPEGCVRFCG